jgi:hypothetical protein
MPNCHDLDQKNFFLDRMARKTRVIRRSYSPIKHAVMASTTAVKGVACESLSGLNRIGSSLTTHANMAVNDLLGKRTRRIKRKKAGKR